MDFESSVLFHNPINSVSEVSPVLASSYIITIAKYDHSDQYIQVGHLGLNCIFLLAKSIHLLNLFAISMAHVHNRCLLKYFVFNSIIG